MNRVHVTIPLVLIGLALVVGLGATTAVAQTGEFNVSIDDINEPPAGEAINVTVEIENVGDETDTQEIDVGIDPFGTQSTDVELDAGNNTTLVHHFTTTIADAGEYTAVAESNDTTAEQTVTVHLPPLPGQDSPPQDTRQDGLANDVTGDGFTTILDVQVFFEHLHSQEVQAYPEHYDFAGMDNDRVSIFDVQAIFNQPDIRLVLEPEEATAAPGGEQNVTIAMLDGHRGLSSFDIDIQIDTAVGEFFEEGVEFYREAGLGDEISVSEDNGTLTVGQALGDSVDRQSRLPLADVTIDIHDEPDTESDIAFVDSTVLGEGPIRYTIEHRNSTITVLAD